jgi:hypothetical protein
MDVEDAVNWVLAQRVVNTENYPTNLPTDLPERNLYPRQPLAELPEPPNRNHHWRYRPRDQVRKTERDLTRDERLEIRVLKKHFPDLTYYNLMEKTGASYRQVQRALHGPPTPKKKGRGGLRLLTDNQRQALLRFLYADNLHRLIPWRDLRLMVPEIASFGEASLTRILYDLGFERRKQGRTRLKLTAANHQLRAQLASE